ncbi:AlpA family phage regulatory protein [Bradyrhizobium sp. McL0616]|uniref:AlpA family phage regulatory protein n=1 Tax=Bradyrhizobium sp. McL0616 TaxID=3415674 RepID=UPI003CF31545
MLNRYRAQGRFPSAVPLGDKRIAFVKSEVSNGSLRASPHAVRTITPRRKLRNEYVL